ncbi:MAG: hypothetical protein H0T62_02485 [Parachlamydiaceae bacterium]|nr:hypothetical protein [Parachlamydiaceae bacterium]
MDSFSLEIILKDLTFQASSAPSEILNTCIELIEPPAPKDMARVTQAKIRKNGRKFLNIALVNKCFSDLVSEKLGVIRTVGLLMNKYCYYNEDNERSIGKRYDSMAHPQLLDAVCTQHKYKLTFSTFHTYDASIDDDIRQIVTLTPQSINCLTELRCRTEVPVLYVACANESIPLSTINFLLENGADPEQEILDNQAKRKTILADLEENDLDQIRLDALKELFQKHRNKNSVQVEEIEEI